VHYSF